MELDIKDLYSGNFRLETLPEVTSKAIKVYLACTSTDFTHERNALVSRVYPKLREYCRNKYGFEFQVVDLRWGVDSEFSDDNPLRSIYQKQIIECQKHSAGPTFVALVGQRYGHTCLPAVIPERDFTLLRGALQKHRSRETRDAALVSLWYRQDTNTMPPVYRLQNHREMAPSTEHFTLRNSEGKKRQADWREIKRSLRKLLQKALDYCVIEETIQDSARFSYLMSDLEREVELGILHTEDPHNLCLAFHRTIVDLNNYITYPQAESFMEVSFDEMLGKLTVDPESDSMLQTLKDKLPQWLPTSNQHHFDVLWKFDTGINPNLHKEYIEKFCKSFHDSMKNLIDRLSHTISSVELPLLQTEVLEHWRTCRRKSQVLGGREEILEIVQSYIISNANQPLVIYGEPGAGKSSMMAQTAIQCKDWIQDGETITIVRFLGTTSNSSYTVQIISSICQQISLALGKELKLSPKTFKTAKSEFLTMLQKFPNDKNLVIVLDSLHNLEENKSGKTIQWIPNILKENVKIVISTLPEDNDTLGQLQTMIQGDQHFVEVLPLVPAECYAILQEMLDDTGQSITAEQQQIVQKSFQSCGLPLYVKLLYRDIKQWKSYSEINPKAISRGVKEYINSIFDQLEHSFGKILVSHSMVYLTVSTTGLSDSEIEDILSLDDEVLKEIYREKTPTVCRIPPLAWIALKHNISNFLMSKECEGVTVNYWTHHLFSEVVQDRYLQDKAKQVYIHSILADYFLGFWHEQEKTYKVPTQNGNELNHNEMVSTDRFVPSQPHTFNSEPHLVRYNTRMYEQVPRHLFLSGRLGELGDKVLFSFEWLYNKTKSMSLQHVLLDFVLNPGVEQSLVEKALRDAQSFIAHDTDTMGVEISGRLLAYYDTHQGIRKLIQGCDAIGVKQCGLLPNFSYQMIPGSPLRFTLSCENIPNHIAIAGPDSRYLLAKDKCSQIMQTFDLVTGEKVGDIRTSIGEMIVTPDGSKILIVDHVTEKAIKLHSITGKYLGQLIPMNQIQMDAKEKYKMGKLSVSDGYACFPVSTEKSYLCIADLNTCRFVEVKGLDGKCDVCEMTPDLKFIFYNVNDTLFSYDVTSLKTVAESGIQYTPSQMLFTADVLKGFMINQQENKLYVLHLNDGDIQMMYKVVLTDNFVDDNIVKISLSQNQELLLLRGKNNLVVFHIESEVVKCHFRRPEDVPKEFKLPKTPSMELFFSAASFTYDNKFVVSAIFRQIQVWNLASNEILARLQAPVGIIRDMVVTTDRGQIITHQVNSNFIQVWGLGDAIGHVSSLDRQTSSIEKVLFTKDDTSVFIKCKASDEIGVMSMSTGHMLDLFTHENQVEDFTITPDGKYLFVSCTSKLANPANVIWEVGSRQVIYQFGKVPAHCLALANESALVSVCQEDKIFNAPYQVSLFQFNNGSFQEFQLQQDIKYVLSDPFVTPEDKFLVILTADGYNDKKAQHINPTICVVAMKSTMAMNCFSADDLCHIVRMRRILHIRPYNNSYTVIALYTNEKDPTDDDNRLRGYEHCYGFMIFDICSGVVCQVIDSFMSPKTPLNDIIFTRDVSICIDNKSNVFDMAKGYYMKNIQPEKDTVPPRCLALQGSVVFYYEGEHLYAVRITDSKTIGTVNVHGVITCINICHDERTVVVGCADGSLVSYVLIDALLEDHIKQIAQIPSRQRQLVKPSSGRSNRSWDKVENGSAEEYSRPTSAMTVGPTDKEMLRSVKPVDRFRPTSDTRLYLNERSRSCAIM